MSNASARTTRRLTVPTPYGVATRRTPRDYRFVVVSAGMSKSYLRARHEEGVKYSQTLAASYRATAAEGGTTRFGYVTTPEQFIKWAEDLEARAAEPFVVPAPGWTVHGWSQSYSGASKMAADATRHGHLGVLVVPVGGETEAESTGSDGHRWRGGDPECGHHVGGHWICKCGARRLVEVVEA